MNAAGMAPRRWHSIVRFCALSLLFAGIGLALVGLRPVQTYVAEPLVLGIAIAADDLLATVGVDIARVGNILTHVPSGATVHVTQACDGLGVFATLAAMVLALRLGTGATLRVLAELFLAIQAFNFVRVITLFELRQGPQALYDMTHLYAMPYATAALGWMMIWRAMARPGATGFWQAS